MYEECNGAEKYYFYDSNGIISGIRYFDAEGTMTMIYVVTNALGDVIALYDKDGNAVVRYEYDAWGNIISIKNGDGTALSGDAVAWNEINPFRYRGYYYDAETELYYLQSRYYDAEVGRFLNADVILDNRALSGINPFTYCGNNPVVRIDSSGTFLDFLWDVVSFACSVKEVIENPTDLGAWGGAILDGVDILVPCVGGLGEVYDVCRVIDKVDDAHDAYKAIDTADDVYDTVKYSDEVLDGGKGFDTYDQLKNEIGPAGEDYQWHHIVEQCQINRTGFDPTMVQNTNNIMRLDKDTHKLVSSYYSSKVPECENMVVRDWLTGKSFEEQYAFGLNVVNMFKGRV